MPAMSEKLFAAYLGGRAPRCNTELHDVVFAVGASIEATYGQLMDKWFGDPLRVHNDSWIELQIVDGHRISLGREPSSQARRLYFIDRRRGNSVLQARGESLLLLFHLTCRISLETFSASDGKNQAARRCSFGGGTLRDCAWRAYKTEEDMGLLRRRPVKREPTCSALRLCSLYSGIPALLGREDVKNLGAYLPGQFTELHANAFAVAVDEREVTSRAKRELLRGTQSVHTDDLYDVDDCPEIAEVDGRYIHLEATSDSQPFAPANGYHVIPPEFVAAYAARRGLAGR
jgi:hypothetical protein